MLSSPKTRFTAPRRYFEPRELLDDLRERVGATAPVTTSQSDRQHKMQTRGWETEDAFAIGETTHGSTPTGTASVSSTNTRLRDKGPFASIDDGSRLPQALP